MLSGADVPEGFSLHDFRDPKLYRLTGGGFACVVGSRTHDGSGAVLLYESDNGFHWHFVSVLDRSSVRNGRLIQNPIRELAQHHGRRVAYSNVPVSDETVLKGVYGRTVDMTITVRPQTADGYELFRMKFAKGSQHYSSLSYRPRASLLHMSRTRSGFNRDFVHDRKCLVPDRDGVLKLRIVLDRFSAEVFVNDGEQALSMTLYTPQTADGISFESQGKTLIQVEKYDIV